LVMAGRVAYSSGEATAKNVPWLSLIVPSHAELILEELQKMKSESFVPPPLAGIVSIQKAEERYNAAIEWIQRHRHAVISNGPFYLDTYIPGAGIISVKAFRDQSYPFPQGYWSVFENPKLAVIQSVDTKKYLTAGEPLKVRLNVTIGGTPSNDAKVDYFLSDSEGRVILNGKAQPLVDNTVEAQTVMSNNAYYWSTNDTRSPTKVGMSGTVQNVQSASEAHGMFEINLNSSETSKLEKGPNSLKIFANSIEAFRPDIYTIPILIVEEQKE
jgi:peptide/nickel transport system substrate-binding protein